MYFLYSLITAAGVILLSPYFLIRGLFRGESLSTLRQRFGRVPEAVRKLPPGAIWIHAVSVGEALAALPLAQRLQQEFRGRPIVVSTTTTAGQTLARERLAFADAVIYFPLDWRVPVRRVLQAVHPSAIIILETEIWPNFLREARRGNVPVVFVNARISDRSYGRYKLANALLFGFIRRVLVDAQAFLAQSERDAARLRGIGAAPEKVLAAGNLKYDVTMPPPGPFGAWLKEQVDHGARRPLIVAGSVTANEEPLVLIAFGIMQGQWPHALLVLAPRKPERFGIAAALIAESQREFVRRSQVAVNGASPTTLKGDTSVVLLDSVGELAALYGLADVVFVGGSLVRDGGHNILEPASFGRPPVFGPSMDNFREMTERFLAAGAGVQVRSPEDLGVAWIELVKDRERRERMGAAARELVERNRGATDRAVRAIAEVLGEREVVAGEKTRGAL